jgi:hypothetical protein
MDEYTKRTTPWQISDTPVQSSIYAPQSIGGGGMAQG